MSLWIEHYLLISITIFVVSWFLPKLVFRLLPSFWLWVRILISFTLAMLVALACSMLIAFVALTYENSFERAVQIMALMPGNTLSLLFQLGAEQTFTNLIAVLARCVFLFVENRKGKAIQTRKGEGNGQQT